MDLTKIAENTEMTYLQKVAAIVDEFAAGNVTGEDADAIAGEAGISPEDLLDVYTAAYGDIEKTAGEEGGEDAGEDAGEEGGEEGGEDLEKEAADEAVSSLIKIAEDVDSTYLTKCAGIADAFAAGALTGEDADALATEIGLAPSDVASIFEAAYGDELEKEAGEKIDAAKKVAGEAKDTVLKYISGKAKGAKEAAGKAGEKVKEAAGKAGEKAKETAGKAGEKVKAGYDAAGGNKTAAGFAGGAIAGGGAAAMFGGKGKDK